MPQGETRTTTGTWLANFYPALVTYLGEALLDYCIVMEIISARMLENSIYSSISSARFIHSAFSGS